MVPSESEFIQMSADILSASQAQAGNAHNLQMVTQGNSKLFDKSKRKEAKKHKHENPEGAEEKPAEEPEEAGEDDLALE